MEDFRITKEMMLTANTYIPLASKIAIAEQIAKSSVVSIKTAEQNKASNKLFALPELKVEKYDYKMILLLSAFLTSYFKIEMPTKDKDGKDLDLNAIYDTFASGHIYNQLEFYKSDHDLKQIAFAISSDFKELRKMVDTEIYNEKLNNNDIITRFIAGLQIYSTPENVKKIMQEMQNFAPETAEEVKTDD